jgi:hypothetical protein
MSPALRRAILWFALLVSSLGLSVSLLSSAAARSGAAVLATGSTPTPTMVPCPTPSDPFSTANPC